MQTKEAILGVLREKLQTCKSGLIVNYNMLNDVEEISTLIATALTRKLYVAIVGYNVNPKSTDLVVYATNIEKAIEWRSIPQCMGTIIVFISGESSKLHSLSEFDTVTSRDLASFIINDKISNSSNTPTREFWAAVNKTISLYPFNMLVDYVAAISEDTEKCGEEIVNNMWRLGLLRDEGILNGRQDILGRLGKNREMILAIGQLSQESRNRLSRTLHNYKNDSQREDLVLAYKYLKQYFKFGKKETLRNLDYNIVEVLLSASKPVRKKIGEATNESIIAVINDRPVKGKELNALINEALLSQTAEDKDFLRDLARAIEERDCEITEGNADTQMPLEPMGGRLEGRSVLIDHANAALRKLVGKVSSSENWGGIINTKERVLRDIIIESDNDYTPFTPTKNAGPFTYGEKGLFDFIAAFDPLIKARGIEAESFSEIIKSLKESREILVENQDLIMNHPNIAFGVKEELRKALNKYIECWSELVKNYCEHESIMRSLSQRSTTYIARSLVCLDVLYIWTNAEWKAILLPLHPLYLWRYYEVFGKIQNIDIISEEDRNRLAKVLSELPNLVNFIIVDKTITQGQDVPLPHSGAIEMLPTFENKTNKYLGVDGIEYIPELLSRWLAFAPYTKNEIRIAIVDTPDLVSSLRGIKNFIIDSECGRVILDAYFTHGQNATGELTRLEYDSKDNDISELIKRNRFVLHINNGTLSQVEQVLIQKPVHIAYFFDQSTYNIEYGAETKYLYVSPLVVTYDYEYDEVAQQGSIFPASDSEDGLIGNYHKMMRYSELISQNSVPRPTFNPDADVSPVNRTIINKAALWLVVADRTTTNYVPKAAIPIGEKNLGRRNLSIWADKDSRVLLDYEKILRKYNLQPSQEKLQDVLSKYGHIASEGLISIPRSGNEEAIESRRKGLLGTIFAAAWYSIENTNSLIASLDTAAARLWLKNFDGNNDRADLIGMRFDKLSNTLNIDVIEVKTRDESADEEHAKEQIQRMITMLYGIFNNDGEQDIFTASRREVLKYQIISECFRNIHNPEWQKQWSKQLKEAFSEHEKSFAIQITGRIVHINLSEAAAGGNPVPVTDDETIKKYTLTSKDIQRCIFNLDKITAPEWVKVDFDDTIENEILQTKSYSDNFFVSTSEVEGNAEEAPDNSAKQIIAERTEEIIESFTLAEQQKNINEINELARDFRKACDAYRIKLNECDPKKAIIGSGVIRFYFTLMRGQSLEPLKNQLEDIGREMRRSGLLIQTIHNSQEIILDVPRLKKDSVLFSEVEVKLPKVTSPEQLFFPIGRTPEGNDIIRDLGELPHMLVGGSTGSGKTVFLFSMLASLIKSHPTAKDMKLLLSSAGVEDFIHFEGLPHLINGKIITSARETVNLIQTIINEEFERRAEIITRARVSNIVEYNKIATEKLPPLIIVIDEFADIADQLGTKLKKEEFYTIVRRIVQIGRKRGVHLVLCTQRASANLVPTDIKAQLNARVALRVNDANSSRMILEEMGAQNLQKHGDLIYKDGEDKLRAQGYLITPKELDDIIAAI